jgi:hypothetical protein
LAHYRGDEIKVDVFSLADGTGFLFFDQLF